MYDKKVEDPGNYFFTRDHDVLKSLSDLRRAFGEASEQNAEAFKFYANNNHNDYSNWLKNVLGLDGLAERLRPIKDPAEAFEIVDDFMKEHIETEESGEEIKEDIETFTKTAEDVLDRVENMKKKITQPSKEMKTEVESLHEELKELTEQVSETRKEGVDVLMPALILKNLQSKVRYFNATRNKEDFKKAKDVAKKLRDELQEAKDYEPLDLKKEIIAEANKQLEEEAQNQKEGKNGVV